MRRRGSRHPGRVPLPRLDDLGVECQTHDRAHGPRVCEDVRVHPGGHATGRNHVARAPGDEVPGLPLVDALLLALDVHVGVEHAGEGEVPDDVEHLPDGHLRGLLPSLDGDAPALGVHAQDDPPGMPVGHLGEPVRLLDGLGADHDAVRTGGDEVVVGVRGPEAPADRGGDARVPDDPLEDGDVALLPEGAVEVHKVEVPGSPLDPHLGDFRGVGHDDLLAPNALYEVANALEKDPAIDVIYTDEDKVRGDELEHFQPHFKPDFNPDLLRSNNYICHFFVVRKDLIEKTGGFRQEYEGAQDYDFIFRCTEQAEKIFHIPEILYHWRTHESSTADNPESKLYAFEAGRRAIEANLEREGLKGIVTQTKDYGFYRVKYPVEGQPMVSIIIPNKDAKEDLEKCINSVLGRTAYGNYEILIVENNSVTKEIFEYYQELAETPKIRLLRWKKEFNYSAINNFAASKARGEYLLFLNNDTEVITSDWMEEMLGFCQRKDTGIVGAKLYYGNDTIQHGGTVIGIGGIAGHMFVDMPRERSGYMHKASIIQDLSAVTAACMMIKKSVFDRVQGFEEALGVAFNDVDLCLRVGQLGYLVVYDPYVELYHYESKSRGAEDSKEKVRRFQTEIEFMRCRWEKLLKEGDPYYNKNLSLTKWNYSLRPLE